VISYIVSVYDRVALLRACLASIDANQGNGDKEILVCCNSTLPGDIEGCELVSAQFGAVVHSTGFSCDNCYDSANLIAPKADGDWLCFPSDDSLYVADFQRLMIQTAVRAQADLVYCDMVYKCGSEANGWKPYSVLSSEPRMGKIDKTNFIVRRELFTEFPPHPRNWRDGALIEKLVAQDIRCVKAPGVLVVHQ